MTKKLEGGGSETITWWGEVDLGGHSQFCRQEVREAWEFSSKQILVGGGSILKAASKEYQQCRERLVEIALTGVEQWKIDRELPRGGRIRMNWQRASWWGGASRCQAVVEKPGRLSGETFVEGTEPSQGYDLCLESMAAQENLQIGGLESFERFTTVSAGPRAFLKWPDATEWTICSLASDPQVERLLRWAAEVSGRPYQGLAGYTAGHGGVHVPHGSQQTFEARDDASWPGKILLEPDARGGCKLQDWHTMVSSGPLAGAAPKTDHWVEYEELEAGPGLEFPPAPGSGKAVRRVSSGRVRLQSGLWQSLPVVPRLAIRLEGEYPDWQGVELKPDGEPGKRSLWPTGRWDSVWSTGSKATGHRTVWVRIVS